MVTQLRSATKLRPIPLTLLRAWTERDVLYVLAGFTVLALAWSRLATGSFSLLVFQDASEQTYAWWQYSVSELHAGRFPLWDPYTFAGRTHVGEGQEGVFYPLFLLIALAGQWAESIAAIQFFAFLHALIGFGGAYLMGRVLGMRGLASMGCGVTYALGSFFSSRALGQLNIFEATAWVPLIVAATLLVGRTRQVRWSMLGGAGLALSVLAGHAEPGLHALMIVTLMLLFLCCVRVWPEVPRLSARQAMLALLVIGCSALGLAAVQLVPMLEYQPLALRWVGGDQPILASDRIPLNVVARNPAFDLRMLPSALIGNAQIPDGGLYVGAAALVCAALGVILHSNPVRLFFVALFVIGVILALGVATPLFGLVFTLPLVDQIREPVRYLLLAHLSLAVLSGLGLDALVRTRRLIPIGVALLSIASAQLGIAWAGSLPSIGGYNAASNREVTQYYSSVEADGVAQFLATQPGLFRIDLTDSPLPRNYGELLRIPTVGGYRATSPLAIQRFREQVGFLPPDRGPDMLGTRYLVSSKPLQGVTEVAQAGSVKIYENPRAFPLAWLVGDVDVAQSSDEALAAVAAPQFDPRRTAIVTASIPALTQLADGSVDITSYMPSNIQMTEHSTGSALLVTSQADYPGWQASIDGRAADLVNVNYAFLGVVVPDGAHSVELAYRPLSVYLGATITAITLILLIGAAVASRRADR